MQVWKNWAKEKFLATIRVVERCMLGHFFPELTNDFMKQHLLLSGLALAIGATGGYLVGHPSGDSAKETAPEQVVKTRSSIREGGGESSRKSSSGRGKMTFEKASAMPGSGAKVQALLDFYGNLRPDQFEGEAAKLDRLPLGERMMASMLLFGKWAESDPLSAVAFANTMGFAGSMVKPTILQSWASVDPVAASKYYAENAKEFSMMGGRGPFGSTNGAATIAGEWALQDPSAALQWAQSLSGDKESAISSVITQIAKGDPAKAIEMLKTVNVEDKSDMIASVALQYGSQNFADAQKWIKTLPADQQADAMSQAISGLTTTNPKEAAKQVALLESGDAKDVAVDTVVGTLVREDPQAAGELLLKHASPEAFDAGVRSLMPTWVSKDPQAALEYANQLQDPNQKDAAKRQWVWSNNTTKSEDVVKVAEGIADDGERFSALAVATSKWLKVDKTAAQNYIQQSTFIPDDQKERFTSGQAWFGGRGGRGGRGR